MSETTACTFIPNFTSNGQTMQKLWTKKHLGFEGKGTRNWTSVSCNHPYDLRKKLGLGMSLP